jgi:hypothetical protein
MQVTPPIFVDAAPAKGPVAFLPKMADCSHIHACFVWWRFEPAMAWAASSLASRGGQVTIISAEPATIRGCKVHVLDDARLLEHPPLGVEAYPIPEMRFAAAAAELIDTLNRRRTFTIIEYAAAGGPGWLISQQHRLEGRFPGALLTANLSHSVFGLDRRSDAQDWFDLGMAIRGRIERLAIDDADVLVSPTQTLASMLGYEDREVVIRRKPAGPLYEPGDPACACVTGPLAHHLRPDVVAMAAVEALDSDPESPLRLRLEGPDTDTGPLGRSCGSRVARYVPAAHASRITIAPTSPAAEQPGTFVFAGDIASDPVAFLAAAVSPVRVIAADHREHRELAEACGRTEFIEWVRPGNVAQLKERLMASCAPSSRGTEYKGEDAIDKLAARAASPRADTAKERSPLRASVVIPFFNLGEYLPQTLESVERQSVKPSEIIVVDDGSTDAASIELLKKLEREGRCVVVRKRNGGLGSARNAGLRLATSRWVLVLDADDVIDDAFLETTLRVAAADPDLAAVGTFMKCFATDPGEVTGGWTPLGIDGDLLASTNMACPASCLINRDAVLGAGGYDEQLVSFEDWDLWCTFAERGMRVAIVPEFLLHYRQRADSMYHAMAKQNEAVLRSQLLARHPGLCRDWSRALRVEVAMRHHVESGTDALAKPLRYVVADRANAALKAMGLQKLVKSAVRRVR